MSRILALDPGTHETGWCVFDTALNEPVGSGILENKMLLETLMLHGPDELAIEMIASYGMPVGKEVFETCVWIGRFIERWKVDSIGEPRLIYRKDVTSHLCGTSKAKDANIRQRLIDLIGPQGTKKEPGPTYGFKSHAWAALAVAVTAQQVAASNVTNKRLRN